MWPRALSLSLQDTQLQSCVASHTHWVPSMKLSNQRQKKAYVYVCVRVPFRLFLITHRRLAQTKSRPRGRGGSSPNAVGPSAERWCAPPPCPWRRRLYVTLNQVSACWCCLKGNIPSPRREEAPADGEKESKRARGGGVVERAVDPVDAI